MAIADVVRALDSTLIATSTSQKDNILEAIRSRGYASSADGFVSNLKQSTGDLMDTITRKSPDFTPSDVANSLMANLLSGSANLSLCGGMAFHYKDLYEARYAFELTKPAGQPPAPKL